MVRTEKRYLNLALRCHHVDLMCTRTLCLGSSLQRDHASFNIHQTDCICSISCKFNQREPHLMCTLVAVSALWFTLPNFDFAIFNYQQMVSFLEISLCLLSTMALATVTRRGDSRVRKDSYVWNFGTNCVQCFWVRDFIFPENIQKKKTGFMF